MYPMYNYSFFIIHNTLMLSILDLVMDMDF